MRLAIPFVLLALTACVSPKTGPAAVVPAADATPPPTETAPQAAATAVPEASATEGNDAAREPLPLDEVREDAKHSGDPLYIAAKEFDRYVHGKLSPEQETELKARCRRDGNGRNNPFCFTLRRSRNLDRLINERTRVHEAPPPSTVEPINVAWEGDGIKNWRELRRGEVG